MPEVEYKGWFKHICIQPTVLILLLGELTFIAGKTALIGTKFLRTVMHKKK